MTDTYDHRSLGPRPSLLGLPKRFATSLARITDSRRRAINAERNSSQALQLIDSMKSGLDGMAAEVNRTKSQIEGFGPVIRGIEKAVRRHEINFGAFKSSLQASLDEVKADLHKSLHDLNLGVEASLDIQGEVLSARLSAVEQAEKAALAELRAQFEALNILQLLAPIEATMGNLSEKVGYIETDNDNIRNRLEFVRNELMFELRRHLNALTPLPNPLPEVTAKFNIDQTSISEKRLKLNLGCGHLPVKGYINVDSRDLPGVEIVASVIDLPFEKGSVEEIFASHLLEHFPARALRDTILPYWRDILKPGGMIKLIAPDAEAMIDAFRKGEFSFDQLSKVIFGGQEYEGDFHFVMLSTEATVSLLNAAGFKNISVLASGRRNGECLEFEIHATR